MTKNATCLHCIDLRIGCLILTGFEFLVGLLLTILITLNWGGVTNSSFGANDNYSRSPSNTSTFSVGRAGLYILFTTFIVTLFIGIVGFVGALKGKAWMLLAYLVVALILLSAEFIGMILAFVNHEWYNGILALIALVLQAFIAFHLARYRQVVKATEHATNYSGVYAPEVGHQSYSANPDLQPPIQEIVEKS